MTVALVGSGPARDAVAAALDDVDVAVTDATPDDIQHCDLAVVVGQAGDVAFETVNTTAIDRGTPWLAVEIGGLGGYPVVEAAVSGFGPETGCYDCLRTRVRANADPSQEPQAAPSPETTRFAGALAGREAARLVAGKQSVALGGVIEIPHAERRVLPVPDCECQPERDRTLERTVVDRDVEESLARAEGALDERVGIVNQVGEAESFPVPYYLATLSDTTGFSDATAAQQAAGVDADWNSAFMKALGEGLERYCAGVYRTSTFATGTPSDVENAVPPSTFVRPTGDLYTNPGEETSIEWVPGKNLITGGEVELPAEFVHFPPPAERFRSAVTTGLGLGNGSVEALRSGLYEVIERDAAMLAWYSTFDPLELDVVDDGFETLVTRARSEGLSVTPLLLTQDVDVPVVAVAVHREEWPRFALGSAAHLDAASAARSALAEAVQNWLELRGMGPEKAADASGAIGHYADRPQAAEAFIDADGTVPGESVGADEVPTGQAHLDTVIDRLDDAGLDVYASRTTTPDVAALGFETVRALVPSAQPLFFENAYFGERAETVPPEIGFEPRLDRDHHPFP
ncbi:YcaO-like family protein [Halorientalis salina]|uniref:YcaO-like family protein n=1 Tax=Halorientalis salina TaxID=2932266 RepID=UPI0010AB7E67|nr:YcaO-like family protein [Halorientalis salina]